VGGREESAAEEELEECEVVFGCSCAFNLLYYKEK